MNFFKETCFVEIVLDVYILTNLMPCFEKTGSQPFFLLINVMVFTPVNSISNINITLLVSYKQ